MQSVCYAHVADEKGMLCLLPCPDATVPSMLSYLADGLGYRRPNRANPHEQRDCGLYHRPVVFAGHPAIV